MTHRLAQLEKSTGLVAQPDSAGELAAALRRLQSEPELLESCGQAGQVRFAAEYRIAEVARHIRAVYADAAQGTARRRSGT